MSDVLERRYRLLLTAFPARHRRQYHEEMLGVLLDRSRPGQRRPTLTEAADLLTAAARIRLRAMCGAVIDDRWRSSGAVIGIIAAVLLASLGLQTIAYGTGWALFLDDVFDRPPAQVLRDLAWLPVVIAAIAGWRTGAATIAWLATLAETVRLADNYHRLPTDLVYGIGPLSLALLASAGLTLAVRHQPVRNLLGRWKTGLLLLAGLLVSGIGVIRALQVEVVTLANGGTGYRTSAGLAVFNSPYLFVNPPVAALYLTALILLLIVLFRLAGAVRRRTVAFALPVVFLYLVAGHGFTDYVGTAHQSVPPLPLGMGQWLLLTLTPIGTLVPAIALMHWYERRRRPDLAG
ncbi:hypothetical protein ABNF97_14045 [Plantactinospora sp. B6F1]|uniref:hypothetical protein n=1 Tax=Plantactinospora sp. B6F1 TaxID=3158971 RepID=UPI0032D92853